MTARTAYLPDPDFAHTPQAKQRRLTKAEQLADFMVEHRISRTPDAAGRRDIARACGLSPSTSDETWAMAIEIWQERR